MQAGSCVELKFSQESFRIETESITLGDELNYVLTISRTTAEKDLKHILKTMDQKLAKGHIELNLKAVVGYNLLHN